MTVELARSLEESGGKVALLGLIDAANPRYVKEMRRERAKESHVHHFQEWMRFHRRRREQFSQVGTARYFARAFRDSLITRVRHFLLRHGEPLFRRCGKVGISIRQYIDNVASVRIENVGPYDGRITLFRPLETDMTHRDPTLGWRDIASGGVDVVWTPGDHETMFKEGNVEMFGRLLQGVLEKDVLNKYLAITQDAGEFVEFPGAP